MRGWSLRNKKTNGWWVKNMWFEKRVCVEMEKLKDWVEIGLRFDFTKLVTNPKQFKFRIQLIFERIKCKFFIYILDHQFGFYV